MVVEMVPESVVAERFSPVMVELPETENVPLLHWGSVTVAWKVLTHVGAPRHSMKIPGGTWLPATVYPLCVTVTSGSVAAGPPGTCPAAGPWERMVASAAAAAHERGCIGVCLPRANRRACGAA